MSHLDNIVGVSKYNTMFHKNEIRREFSGRIRATALIPVTQNVQLIIGYVWGNRRIITGRPYRFVLCNYTHIVTFVLVRLYAVFRSYKITPNIPILIYRCGKEKRCLIYFEIVLQTIYLVASQKGHIILVKWKSIWFLFDISKTGVTKCFVIWTQDMVK